MAVLSVPVEAEVLRREAAEDRTAELDPVLVPTAELERVADHRVAAASIVGLEEAADSTG